VPVASDKNVRLQSSYLDYLPALYRDDEFIGQFLLIFESIIKPIENTIDHAYLYFDPMMTPESFLPFLAFWMGLKLEPTWSEEKRRELVKSAAELYQWRGTKRGLSKYLQIYTGKMPQISEYATGMRLDRETRLGINTQIGSAGEGNHFTVTLELDEDSKVDPETVKAIIDAQKPAHATYTLQITHGGGG